MGVPQEISTPIMNQLLSFSKVVCAILLPLISMARAGILPTNQRTLYEIFGSGIDTDDNLRTKGFDEPLRDYKWSYGVADYINENYQRQTATRDNGVVTGEYSYIDTFCGLITVKYTATPDNYEEKREYEPDFIDCSGATTQAPITTRRPTTTTTTTTPKPTTTPRDTNEDLIAKIIKQLSPHIKNTVHKSLKSE